MQSPRKKFFYLFASYVRYMYISSPFPIAYVKIYNQPTSVQNLRFYKSFALHVVSTGQMWRNDHWAPIIFELSKKLQI